MPNARRDVAVVHDYLTQRGGAERVALDLVRAFPGAPLYTSLYDPASTFPEFAELDVRCLAIDRIAFLRRHHRMAFPLLAPAFASRRLDYEVVVCSSSGWAHGVRNEGRKVVYCHTPARWLYQTNRYLGERYDWARFPFEAVAMPLRSWDRRGARSADRYIVNSSIVRDRVGSAYGIDAEVLPPPPGITPDGPTDPVAGLDAGFVLCVSRLLEYKNVEQVVDAFRQLPDQRLVIAGAGPLLAPLSRSAPPNVVLTGVLSESQLRWLYASCSALVAASYEDFGLTPVEGFSFGKPVAALRFGGYLDTVRPGENGLFFDAPEPDQIAEALRAVAATEFAAETVRATAERFAPARFDLRIREIVDEELAAGRR